MRLDDRNISRLVRYAVGPAALIVLAAVIAFVVSARRGQFDALDTPPVRILNDDL